MAVRRAPIGGLLSRNNDCSALIADPSISRTKSVDNPLLFSKTLCILIQIIYLSDRILLLGFAGYSNADGCWQAPDWSHQSIPTEKLSVRPIGGVPGNSWKSLSVRLSAIALMISPGAAGGRQVTERDAR